MELEQVLLKRRSVRKFKQDKIDNEMMEKILYYAMCAPSACNRQPWEFYVIKDEAVLTELKKASRFTNHDAPLAIVVAGNEERFLPRRMKDYWVQDCASAITHILLEATNLGLGSLWCGLYPQEDAVDRVRGILHLEENIIPMGLVLLGYPDEFPEERTQYDETKVHIIEENSSRK